MTQQLSLDEVSIQTNDNTFWQAVLNRDARFDGVFVYGVMSTRIFCRPTCPSRRPNRGGARFFDNAQLAAQNGFRACKRCRPEAAQNANDERIERLCRLIEAAPQADWSLEKLSREIGLSASHLQRTFKRATGLSPREYVASKRLQAVKSQLQNGDRVLDAVLDAGYDSSRALYDSASQWGMTPATYGRGGMGAIIRFDIAPCCLGFLLVAATEKGVCSVALGDARDELEAALRREFPRAEIVHDSETMREQNALRDALQAALRVLDEGNCASQLPLDIRATAFQARVWKELRSIQRGETLSYAQLAQRIGQPSAARAVARACATNPLALIVPCHRVVGSNGALSGYRWGTEKKSKLLDREKTQR